MVSCNGLVSDGPTKGGMIARGKHKAAIWGVDGSSRGHEFTGTQHFVDSLVLLFTIRPAFFVFLGDV